MNEKEAFNRLSKAQVIDLIIWQMFAKSISLEELTVRIQEAEKDVIRHVNEHLTKHLGEDAYEEGKSAHIRCL